MEKEEFLPDDFLKELFRNKPLESPGDRFVENIMGQITPVPEVLIEKKTFAFYLRSSWMYVLLFVVVSVVLMTSDLPFTNFMPGKEFLTKTFLPYLGTLLAGVKPLLSNAKFISIALMAILAGILLLGLDYFLSRRSAMGHQITH
jgi:hypothetical protein